MKRIRVKVAFSDKRGDITDLIQKDNINAVTHITIKKGAIRGNHYHKKTIQWNYVLSGKLKLITKLKARKKSIVMNKGDLVASEPMESHALVGVTNCELLVFTKGPRGGKRI